MRSKHLYRAFVKQFGKRQTKHFMRIQHKRKVQNGRFYGLCNSSGFALKILKIAGDKVMKLTDAIVHAGDAIRMLGNSFKGFQVGGILPPPPDIGFADGSGLQFSDGSYVPVTMLNRRPTVSNETKEEL